MSELHLLAAQRLFFEFIANMRTIKLKYCIGKVMQLIFSMQHGQFLYRSWTRDNLGAWSMMEALWNLLKRNWLKGKVKEKEGAAATGIDFLVFTALLGDGIRL